MSRNEASRRRQQRAKANSDSNGRLKIFSMMFICVLVLASGFFFAARQHFSSIDYGIRNSRLRKQLDDLEAEKRRLVVAREVSLSPAEIKKAAKKLGITDSDTDGVQLASLTKSVKTADQTPSLVKATVSSAPATTAMTASYVARTAKISESTTHPQKTAAASSDKDKQKKPRSLTALYVAAR